ncbi:MAG: FGGY family carbohydrate kinase [Rhizobiaceae bacterium]|nr:FGGY family carbohydrate kinase [Rhizobiaceae bacterium]
MVCVAAIDQGTTSTRILTVDGDSLSIKGGTRHAQHYPQPGWVEHDALELLANVRSCIGLAGPEVQAIGLANQGESCLAWDRETLEPLSAVIVWQDNRTTPEIAELRSAGAEELTRERAGLPVDPYFSAAKFRWMLDNIEAVGAAHRNGRLCLGTTDAFFLHNLTGRFATDVTTASRTSLMNIRSCAWDEQLCALFRVPMDCLPGIERTVSDFGSVGSLPVTASVVDQQAALYGHGCRRAGDSKITFGTGAFALTVTGSEIVPPEQAAGLLPTVAWDIGDGPVYALDGGVYDAGSSVEWALKAGLADNMDDFGAFDQPAAIDRGLVFIPAFSGLACPYWDRTASPVMLGLTPEMSRSDMRQALLEGIALLTANVLAAMSGSVPLAPAISIDGGLSRSPYFAQFLADSLGREVRTSSFDEMTAFGTASLAAKGLGAELELAPGAETVRTFKPRPTSPERATLFARAVERARGWR